MFTCLPPSWDGGRTVGNVFRPLPQRLQGACTQSVSLTLPAWAAADADELAPLEGGALLRVKQKEIWESKELWPDAQVKPSTCSSARLHGADVSSASGKRLNEKRRRLSNQEETVEQEGS